MHRSSGREVHLWTLQKMDKATRVMEFPRDRAAALEAVGLTGVGRVAGER